MEQLDLFTLKKANEGLSAPMVEPPKKLDPEVAAFPLARRVDMVRKVAAALDCRDYKAGQRYWSTHVHQERAKLARQGISRDAIDAEITRYTHAISRALRLHEQFGRPDDAA